jgi:hypothetical protein
MFRFDAVAICDRILSDDPVTICDRISAVPDDAITICDRIESYSAFESRNAKSAGSVHLFRRTA